MVSSALVTAILALGQAAAPAPTVVSPDPNIQVTYGLYSYRSDGTIGGSAVTTLTPDELFATSIFRLAGSPTGCSLGAGDPSRGGGGRFGLPGPESEMVTYRWNATATIESWQGAEIRIRHDARRELERAGVPAGSALSFGRGTMVLHPGDRVVLDEVSIPNSPCNPRIALEMRVVVRGDIPATNGRTSGSGGARAVAAGGGGLASAGSTRGAAFGNANQSQVFSVDLWLVRSRVDGGEEVVQQQRAMMTPYGQVFAFAPVPRRDGDVDIGGSLAIKMDGDAASQLLVAMGRSMRRGPDARRLPPNGTSLNVVSMPGPDDVLSFEMPPLPDAPAQEQLSLRLQVRRVR